MGAKKCLNITEKRKKRRKRRSRFIFGLNSNQIMRQQIKSIQMTYWIPFELEQKLRKTAENMQINRQSALTHILKLYYHKDWKTDSSLTA